eukprot:GSChrysophyteH1.ASY1.ANO1.3052.1 assembled CDS
MIMCCLWILSIFFSLLLSEVSAWDAGSPYRNTGAFAALKVNGAVTVWGDPEYGGSLTDYPAASNQFTNGGVLNIYSTAYSGFCALTKDGSAIWWGGKKSGMPIYDPSSDLAKRLSIDVVKIAASDNDYAALKKDGTIVAWGTTPSIGNMVPTTTGLKATMIYSNAGSFAILYEDGSVKAFGPSESGSQTIGVAQTNVKSIQSTEIAFTALHHDGTVYSWGNPMYGGDGPRPQLSNIQSLYSNQFCFAALDSEGRLFAWGRAGDGGKAPAGISGVLTVYSSSKAFAARTSEEKVICWGAEASGGDCSDVSTRLIGIKFIAAGPNAFAALRYDGAVVSWGGPVGMNAFAPPPNAVGMTWLVGGLYAFAGVNSEGSIVAWGQDATRGGTAPNIGLQTANKIWPSGSGAFAATLAGSGEAVSWGSIVYEGLVDVRTIFGNAVLSSRSTSSSIYDRSMMPTPSPTLSPTATPTVGPTPPPKRCPPGSYYLAGTTGPEIDCAYCAAGTFNPYYDQASCFKCTAGTSSIAVGSTVSKCDRCPAGRYADAGSTACTICPAGKNAPPTAKMCTDCPAGFYSLEGQECQMCPVGTYSTAGSIRCESCGSGAYAAPGSSQCTTCG